MQCSDEQCSSELECLLKEEVSYPFKSISIDLADSFYKESFVITVDSFSNYTWVERLGYSEQGTSRQIINAMRNQMGTGLHLTKKIHQDNDKNLNWDKIKD